ncbi:MAG TPA: FlgD immunoglobulin-like domain containing protein [Candidatus Limnocylindria bacterium]|nr:FlgD immunoglobulin-like domain containing protein [Candidatus Limnocylindria bacterium]
MLDIAGRVMRTLASGTMAEGRHDASWDGTDHNGQTMAPGVYFYRLTTRAGSETRRMIMLQ